MNLRLICIFAFAAICLLIIPADAAINLDNIMGMWLFNDSSGDTAKDSSNNKNDGKIYGAKSVNGKFGKALEFDGTDDWVEVQHSDTVGFTKGTSFSITLYFKGTKIGGSLVGKNYEDTTEAKPWYLLWNGDTNNLISIYLRNTNDENSKIDGTIDLGDDEWHFIAAIADAGSKKISLWVDGKKDVEGDFDTSDGYGTSEGVLHFARHHNRYTAGIIDDVALFNVALSENEMNSIMNNGIEESAAVEPVNKLATTWGKIKNK